MCVCVYVWVDSVTSTCYGGGCWMLGAECMHVYQTHARWPESINLPQHAKHTHTHTQQEGARAVKIEYEDLQPVITNIEEGVARGSFFAFDHTVQQGPAVEVSGRGFGGVAGMITRLTLFAALPICMYLPSHAPPHINTPLPQQAALATPGAVLVEGEMKIGGQEHFYLEPNATLAIPGEVRGRPMDCVDVVVTGWRIRGGGGGGGVSTPPDDASPLYLPTTDTHFFRRTAPWRCGPRRRTRPRPRTSAPTSAASPPTR